MLIDKSSFHAKHDAKDLIEALQVQVAMWRYESHCWVVQENSGLLRCSWCNKERAGNFSPATNPEQRAYPLCEYNPALKEFALINSRAALVSLTSVDP